MPNAAEPSSPSRRPLYLGVLLVVVALAAVAGLWRRHERPKVLRIATGAASGTFYPLGKTLAQTFAHARDGERVDLKVLATSGTGENLALLGKHEADLALVSNGVPGNASTTLVAPLFAEAVQLIVRKDARIATPFDLKQRRVSIGPAASGTEKVALIILQHFGLHRDDFTARNLPPNEASAALERGEVDALFLVARLGDPTVDAVLKSKPGAFALLSLGDPQHPGSALEGIRLGAPYLQPTVIPERTYGSEPEHAIGTVSMQALLVAHVDLDDELVASLTAALYADKVRLTSEDVQFARLSERFDPGDSPYPLHPGADRYYRRDDPSFIAKNADQISLGLTIGAILWSTATALNAYRRRRRSNRVETCHQELARLATAAAAAPTVEELRRIRAEIETLRDQIYAELAHKRLEGTPDVMILQHRLDGQLAELDRRLAERLAAS